MELQRYADNRRFHLFMEFQEKHNQDINETVLKLSESKNDN